MRFQFSASGKKLKETIGTVITDYVGNTIYKNDVLYQISHDEGRIINGVFEYNINDHLGNLRVSFRDSSGIAVPTQSIFYDAFGLSMKGMQITRIPTNFNKHQFLNRETQFETGYIDLQNRQYDPQRGQFTSQDPLAELSRRFSPTVYGMNNMLRFIDPDGMKARGYVSASGYYSRDDGGGGDQEEVEVQDREDEQRADDKDKDKKKPLPTLEQAMAAPHLNPNGDGIQADHTIESIVIPIFRPIGWAFRALKFRFLANVAAKEGNIALNVATKEGENIALGVREHLTGFANSVNGTTWRVWGATDFESGFLNVINNSANKIHFNLNGIENPWSAISQGAKGFQTGGFTNWELYKIYSNSEVLKRTTFYLNGNVVPSPF